MRVGDLFRRLIQALFMLFMIVHVVHVIHVVHVVHFVFLWNYETKWEYGRGRPFEGRMVVTGPPPRDRGGPQPRPAAAYIQWPALQPDAQYQLLPAPRHREHRHHPNCHGGHRHRPSTINGIANSRALKMASLTS